ncbi:MAG TPA: excinuclease ABC subunit B, partial [Planctomycetes bacterium]|nr:excinuclease ABC subunit B [Planctomycetota bacterium]
EVERLARFAPLTGDVTEPLTDITIFPAKQFVTQEDKIKRAMKAIRVELRERIAWFEKHNKLLEAQRIKMRTEYDLEMMEELGYCSGIENYSRHISGREAGSRSHTLMDFFPRDFLLIIDESHATLPQLHGMYAGDRSRKTVLVEHGFRLPSALDNRPMNFEEFQSMQGQTIYASATPSKEELGFSAPRVAEQIVRPTGLVDPPVTVKPLKGQIDDLIEECRKRVDTKQRVLVTTLTKRTAEELTDYLRNIGINVRYLHSEIDAIERVEILRALRKGEFDVLVGINLLREGLDLPEVSLVAILDADKEGFLRSTTSLIQTAGRASRHLNGEVILYADVMTRSIKEFMALSSLRRARQLKHNKANGITPRSVSRAVEDSLADRQDTTDKAVMLLREGTEDLDVSVALRDFEAEMIAAAENLEFEKAAHLRDQINQLKRGLGEDTIGPKRKVNYRQGKHQRTVK